jgi:ribosomal protein S18 acetylase RimI-like enzyme
VSEQLTETDCRRLAALHVECLPDSLVSRLGRRYAVAFYRYLSRSDHERVFVHREDGRIASACVLSLRPQTLARRLALGTPLLWFAPRLLAGLLWANVPARQAARTAQRGDPGRGLPEVTHVFTAPEARGRGAASALLDHCEEFLLRQDHSRYVTKTVDDDANPALAFYRNRGFAELGWLAEHGLALRVLLKTLPDGSPSDRGRERQRGTGSARALFPGSACQSTRCEPDPWEHAPLPVQRIYNVLFPGPVPPKLSERFRAAWRQREADYTEPERVAYRRAVARVGDLEALELACRRSKRLPILSDQVVLMSYLAETLPEHYGRYVGPAPGRLRACGALAAACSRSTWKYTKGLLLRRQVHA